MSLWGLVELTLETQSSDDDAAQLKFCSFFFLQNSDSAFVLLQGSPG